MKILKRAHRLGFEEFLGVCLNSVRMEARLDFDKLAATLSLLSTMLNEKANQMARFGKCGWQTQLVCQSRLWRSHFPTTGY